MKVTDEKSRILIRIRNPGYGSKDPDKFQNVRDPEHCYILQKLISES
jgi:hypothetical protein